VAISATNLSYGPDYAVVFDSNLLNLAPDTDLGFMLIIQENAWGCADGVCDLVDDEGSRPPGSIEFDFSGVGAGLFTTLQFDIVDVESTTAEEGQLDFFRGLGIVGTSVRRR